MYGKYSRDNWNGDTNFSTIIVKFVKCFNIEEQLGDDKVSASVDLFLQVHNIFVIGCTIRMTARIAWKKILLIFITENLLVDYLLRKCKNDHQILFGCEPLNLWHKKIRFRLISTRHHPQDLESKIAWSTTMWWIFVALPPRSAKIFLIPWPFALCKYAVISSFVLLAHVRCSMVSMLQ